MAGRKFFKKKKMFRRHRKGKLTSGMQSGLKEKSKAFKKYNTGCILGGSLSFPFPPRLRTLMRCIIYNPAVVSSAATDGNAQDLYFKINSVNAVGQADNYPLGSATGFTNNVPTGLYYLLSSDTTAAGGSVAPYSHFLVRKCSIRMEFSTEGASNKSSEVIIVPRPDYQVSSVAVSATVNEQPLAKSWTIPPVLNTKGIVCTHSIDVRKLFGISLLDTSLSDYVGTIGTDPIRTGAWQVRIRNIDGSTTTRSLSYKCQLVYDVELFNMNYMTSAVPA